MKKNKRNIAIVGLILILFICLQLCNLLNIKIGIVVSNSMEPVLSVNDLIVTKKEKSYNVRDVIVYRTNDESVVHRIVSINQQEIITKGDANDYEDKPITLDSVYGKLIFSIPYVGGVVSFFKTNYGIYFSIGLVIIMFLYSCIDEVRGMSRK